MRQISRFDPWKDPSASSTPTAGEGEGPGGAARARRLDGHRRSGGLGLLQRDDRARRRRPGHPHPQQPQHVGAIEVNAFQPQADVVIQKSTREGFGLTVTEAIWKGAPVHRRQRRRDTAQIDNGVSGFRRQCRRVRAARARHPSRPGPGQGRSGAAAGARAHPLPHAALPARLSADLQRTAGGRDSWRAAPARARLEPRAGHVRGGGSVKRGTAAS